MAIITSQLTHVVRTKLNSAYVEEQHATIKKQAGMATTFMLFNTIGFIAVIRFQSVKKKSV